MPEDLKILLLEDDSLDAELIINYLRKNNFKFIAEVAKGRSDFINLLDNFLPDIVLADHRLPCFDSIEALEILNEKKSHLPFILVTGAVTEEFAVTIIKMGADDYILKNNLTRLGNAILNALQKRKIEKEKENYQQQLEKKIQEINTFFYRVSHDLKAPLASIFGILHIANEKFKDDPFVHYLDMIGKSSKKLDSILMSFSEVGKLSFENFMMDKINLKEIVEEIIAALKNLPTAAGIEFRISVKEGIEYYGNKNMVSSVFQNLIYNSILYRRNIPDSYISIEISEDAKFIYSEIKDNGTGIEKEHQSRIFDMFYRASTVSNGSGLGLYIVKNSIDKSGGEITLSSKENEGTSFKITLPKK